MTNVTRFLRISVLVLSSIGANAAQATPMEIVFDNTTNPSTTVFGPSCCQVGNEISLGGNARTIAQLSWLVDSQNYDVVADIETQIHANDGLDGAPSTLLWESGPLTGINVSATDTILDISVPMITVPETVTVTSRIITSTPVALGRVYGGPASVGSVNTSWVKTSEGAWQEGFEPWSMQVSAVSSTVPEPSTLLLLGSGFLVIFMMSQIKSRSKNLREMPNSPAVRRQWFPRS